MADRVSRVAIALVATCLLVGLAGSGPAWLPSTSVLVAILLALNVGCSVLARNDGGVLSDRLWQWLGFARFHWFSVALLCLAAVGTALRFAGIGADLGHIPIGIDENRLARSVLSFFRTGEIDHRTVEHYPGIFFWILSGSYLGTYLWELMSGTAERVGQIPTEHFVLVGRMTSALVDVCTIAVTGLLGKRLAGPRVGIVAALVVTASPLSVQISAQMRNDSTLVLLATSAILATVWTAGSEQRSPAFFAGLLAGLAAAVKYSGVFVLVPVLVSALVVGRSADRVHRFGLSILGFVVALAVTNHFLWADLPNFLRQLGDQIAITSEGHWAARDNPAWFYIEVLTRRGTGWVLLLLAGALAVWGLAGRKPAAWLLIAFPLCYLWFMPQRPSQLPRWVYPLVPSVAIAGSWMLTILVDQVKRRTNGGGRPRFASGPVAVVIVLLAVAQPLARGLCPRPQPAAISANSWAS